jgi:hypothetical protein
MVTARVLPTTDFPASGAGARGARGSLSKLWALAESEILSAAPEPDREACRNCLARGREVLRDGEVIGCDGETPSRLLTHLWSAIECDKARQGLDKVDRLEAGLGEILNADYAKSIEARAPDILERSVGPAFEAAFDFQAMSSVLASASPEATLPESRRRRIGQALSVLRSQRFFVLATNGGK